jgi:hypothetical protein
MALKCAQTLQETRNHLIPQSASRDRHLPTAIATIMAKSPNSTGLPTLHVAAAAATGTARTQVQEKGKSSLNIWC